jgi:hypothetical protein
MGAISSPLPSRGGVLKSFANGAISGFVIMIFTVPAIIFSHIPTRLLEIGAIILLIFLIYMTWISATSAGQLGVASSGGGAAVVMLGIFITIVVLYLFLIAAIVVALHLTGHMDRLDSVLRYIYLRR